MFRRTVEIMALLGGILLFVTNMRFYYFKILFIYIQIIVNALTVFIFR